MATQFTKKKEISRDWLVVDAKDQVVGRLASNLAMILMGKHKPTYSPNHDNGDYIVVLNADKVKFTGNKWDEKPYYDHSGYMKGLKTTYAKDMLVKKPDEILKRAVWGMMPKTNLARRQIMKMKIYTGDKHPHSVQNPKALKISPMGKVLN